MKNRSKHAREKDSNLSVPSVVTKHVVTTKKHSVHTGLTSIQNLLRAGKICGCIAAHIIIIGSHKHRKAPVVRALAASILS